MKLEGPETETALREFVGPDVDKTLHDRVTFRVRSGDPAEVILDEVAREQTLLIVMGTHGLGGIQKLLIGSTTEHVLRQARRPVLAVPPSPEGAPQIADPSAGIRKILVGTDFSAAAMDAVRWAARFAGELGVPLLIAHIVVTAKVAPAWQPLVEQANESRVSDARGRMDELKKEFPGLSVETIVEVDRADDALPSLAEQRGASLIVLGLGSQEGARAQHPGIIAYRVLSRAKVPVLLVPRGA
jgi:nucleotide-binding universal stress UspA family protein